jgi:hypothetical protein
MCLHHAGCVALWHHLNLAPKHGARRGAGQHVQNVMQFDFLRFLSPSDARKVILYVLNWRVCAQHALQQHPTINSPFCSVLHTEFHRICAETSLCDCSVALQGQALLIIAGCAQHAPSAPSDCAAVFAPHGSHVCNAQDGNNTVPLGNAFQAHQRLEVFGERGSAF